MMDQYQYDELNKLSKSSVNNEHSQRMGPRGRGRGGGGGDIKINNSFYTYHSIQTSR